jgi:hypothetical protein
MEILMKRTLQSILLLVLIAVGLSPAKPVAAAISPSACEADGLQTSGAVYRICMPALAHWNHDLVIYAHGYVGINEPVGIPEDQLTLPGGGPSIAEIVNTLGYAFAASSYSTNGLAIQQGIDDVVDLVNVFATLHGQPERVYIAGPSEGGIITALAIERHPEIFAGGLSACGPVGDFPSQINYWGDVRATFDFFFPNVLPGSSISVPQEAMDNWERVYEPRVRKELQDHPDRRDQWMVVANIPQEPSSLDATLDSLTQLLWYSVFATNDGVEKLGGQPFDNLTRIYTGSRNDSLLNYAIERYSADANAIQEMQAHYQTSGDTVHPLVMLHTTDPLIPMWHEGFYALKVTQKQRESLVTSLTFPSRYGHCNFRAAQVLLGFIVLIHEVTHSIPANAEVAIAADQRPEFLELMEEQFEGVTPTAPGEHLYLPQIEDPSSE